MYISTHLLSLRFALLYSMFTYGILIITLSQQKRSCFRCFSYFLTNSNDWLQVLCTLHFKFVKYLSPLNSILTSLTVFTAVLMCLRKLLCLSLQPGTRLRRAELSKASEDLEQQFATALASSAQVVSTFDFTNCCKAVPNCRNVAVLFHTESKTPFCSTHSIQGKSRPYKMKVPKEKTVLLDQTDS